ncbi:DUF5008 domain-containing protein [Flagellimonas algicola]|uniref:DUF5008 domain-containing protein n=1 Tax=Flagellimonas algicola TaxID=2583815 RepID=A0ABY2WGX7_9FLAO|nr:DUF5008 domain-containing protein [Allomuricauda algicola]
MDIIGENFSTTLGENQVKFGNVDAEVTNATATKLDVTVPDGAETAKITVTINNQTATSENEFVVNDPSPKILSFTPTEGGPGTEVTITGIGLEANYGSDKYNISFSGNGAEPQVLSVSDTELVVVVPGSLITGPISIYLDGETITSEDDFILLTGRWTQLDDFGGAERYDAQMFALNELLYIGMGANFNLEGELKDLWEYNLSDGTSLQLDDFLGEARNKGVGYNIDGKFYYGGGESNYDFWEYDPETEEWTQKADLGHLTDWRANAAAFSIDGKGYVFGGTNALGEYSDMLEYDPENNTWKNIPGPPADGRQGHIAFAIGNKGYIGCGYTGDDQSLSDLWEYDPEQENPWSAISVPFKKRSEAISFVVEGKGYIGLGYDSGTDEIFNDLWEFDPVKNEWTKKLGFPGEERFSSSAVDLNGRGYVGLGYTFGKYFNDIWEFDPQNE